VSGGRNLDLIIRHGFLTRTRAREVPNPDLAKYGLRTRAGCLTRTWRCEDRVTCTDLCRVPKTRTWFLQPSSPVIRECLNNVNPDPCQCVGVVAT
jgi:hypothetical protein